ncbi:MAG: hypothetical protein AB1384_05290 [Actinomycetota bacterium]
MADCCRECGVPRLLSLTQAWREGCIIDTTSGSASLCVYEASYPTALIRELEERLGIPLDRIVYLAGTHAAVKVLGVLYESHPLVGKLLFSAPLHRMTERILVKFGRAIGVANVEILERHRREGALVMIEDPFDLSNCLAIISGILQIADGCQIAYEILEGGGPDGSASAGAAADGSYLVRFFPAPAEDGEEEAYQRLFAENLSPGSTGGKELARCGKCGAPRAFGDLLSFDLGKGLIRERAGGERVILMGVHGLNTIIRELTWELGQVVGETFIAFERQHLLARLRGGGGVSISLHEDPLREYLALRGLGYLREVRDGDGGTSFVVENAFIAPLVAGRLLAMWETEYGRTGSYEFDVSDDVLRLFIH